MATKPRKTVKRKRTSVVKKKAVVSELRVLLRKAANDGQYSRSTVPRATSSRSSKEELRRESCSSSKLMELVQCYASRGYRATFALKGKV